MRTGWLSIFTQRLCDIGRVCDAGLRRYRRWHGPPGLFVVVLGSDGAGKSTLIEHLREGLLEVVPQIEVFHLRPDLVGRRVARRPVTDPHGKVAHPWWLSCLKIFYYVLIYDLGYLLRVRPHLWRATLVLFDRYYDDLLVDPHRYRYGGSMRLARFARRLVPRPDLFLVIDVPEEQLLQRKREVAPRELRRQREAYGKLRTQLPAVVVLDGSAPVDEIAKRAHSVIMGCLRQRRAITQHANVP